MDKVGEYDYYLFYDKPIPYKELLIYPATMDRYLDFHFYITCLLLDKNSIPNPEVITMTYLQFMYYMASTTELPYLYMFKELLKMVLHIDNDSDLWFGTDPNGKAIFKIKGIIYDSDDLNKITDIIFLQNSIEHIDDTIQKEVRDAMEKARVYKMKQNEYKMCSLEDQMVCVLISTSLKFEDINKLTIRKFSKILERVDYKLHYEIYLSAEMSGMVKFKDENKLKHWMADLTKSDKYEDVKVDADEMHHKIDDVNK
ncbi:MAG: hypothetical protein VZQ62_03940 [Methanosphaera sp.]|jgi:hypothetical protein|nr:hypothetical protein [Methanosphaera sp.]